MAHSLRKRSAFRILAILMGLTPFALAELGLQLADWPRPRFTQDPYVSFDGHERLFRLDESQDKYITSPIRFPYFYPDSFSRVKPKQTTRIFCLGGSTVQGRPYSIETSFTTWLRLTLESAQPERQWEVVNCGGISYASYRLRYVAREVLDYEPDLIIVYTGHNEFLERRSFDVVKNSPRLTNVTQQTIRRSKLVSLAATIWETATGVSHDSINVDEPGGDARRTRLKQEVDALLDYRGGLEEYHRGELQHDLVTDHFRHSLTAIASAASIAEAFEYRLNVLILCLLSVRVWRSRSMCSVAVEDPAASTGSPSQSL